jgi:RNA polymerase sigma-70 factor (ECF subfamily)
VGGIDGNGDVHAGLARTYEAHADSVRRAAYSVVQDSDLAEDVTQDVFLALWTRPERYDPERGSVESFLRVMARSRALDAVRRAGASQRAQDRLDGQTVMAERSEPDLAEGVVAALRARHLRQAILALPAEQRETVSLAYWGRLTSAEVAAQHGVPLGTAKSRMRIALDKLRTDFADYA